MGISGSVTATFQGTRDVYFRARQIFAGGGQTGAVFANPWSVVVGEPLFGYEPTLDVLQRPVAGFGQIGANTAKGVYDFTSWEFGNQSDNNNPGDGSNGGNLINGALYGQWVNGGDVGSWRASNGATRIDPTFGLYTQAFSAPTVAKIGATVGAVVQLYTNGAAMYVDNAGQTILPSFWDTAEEPSFGGVIFNDVTYLLSTDAGLSQKLQVIVLNGVEQYRRYLYLDSVTYNQIINDPAFASAAIFSFSNGYMVVRSPYIPGQLIVINGDCSKWWLYNCKPVNNFALNIFKACDNNWGVSFLPNAIMSPLGYMTLSGFSVGASADIYSSFVLEEVNPNTLANPGRRLPIANCWNCLPNAQGHR